jgi:signal transduction histidine kinase
MLQGPTVVVLNERWREEIQPSVRHLLRLRRLEEENRTLLSKLTEANALLEERNKRLNEFSATLAHDIRGPLGGISMKLEYTLDHYAAKLEPRCVDLLQRTLKASERLNGIVQGMYDFARLGAKATIMAPIPLATFLDEVAADLNVDTTKDVRLTIGEMPTVYGTDALLRRVFINLIANAIKYSNKPCCEISVYQTGMHQRSIAAFAEIVIEDNGPGIPQDEIRDLFSMFSRGTTSHGDTEGVGIGLAVVQRIIELHYGKIRVESEVGKGTKFIMQLPVEKIELGDS